MCKGNQDHKESEQMNKEQLKLMSLVRKLAKAEAKIKANMVDANNQAILTDRRAIDELSKLASGVRGARTCGPSIIQPTERRNGFTSGS